MVNAECLQIHDYRNRGVVQWQALLASISKYKGEVIRSAELLKNLVEGIEWVREQIAKEKIMEFSMPDLYIVTGHDDPTYKATARLWQARGMNTVFAELEYLITDSQFDKNILLEDKSSEDYILFKGFIDDLYFLGGVEEADHARFDQVHSHENLPIPIRAPIATGPVYAAQQHEFEALLAQLKAAIDRRMPEPTIRILKQRIVDAQKVRDLFSK